MKPKIFFVGPSIPKIAAREFSTSHILVHAPLIRLHPFPISRSIWKSLQSRPYRALILTSAFPIPHIKQIFNGKSTLQMPFHIFCVGKMTQKMAKKAFGITNPHILFHRALEERQEGLFSLIRETMCSSEGLILWPSSTQARGVLSKLLHDSGYLFDQLSIYSPIANFIRIQWQKQDTIFFSCSSSVRAFFTFFPMGKWDYPKFRAIGEVTQKSIDSYIMDENSHSHI